jgi:hypothetical protein
MIESDTELACGRRVCSQELAALPPIGQTQALGSQNVLPVLEIANRSLR